MIKTTSRKLLAALDHFPQNNFLISDGVTVTYEAAWKQIIQLTNVITDHAPDQQCVGILSNRDLSAYVGTLACLAGNKAFIPLTQKTPRKRVQEIATSIDLKTIIVGKGLEEHFLEIFENFSEEIVGLCLDKTDETQRGSAKIRQAVHHNSTTIESTRSSSSNDYAYILFTSGSTGAPKGVPITYENLNTYIENASALFQYQPTDVVTQTFELSFDLSIHDLMCTWCSGAALLPLSRQQLLSPQKLLTKYHATAWFSVPSQAALMSRARQLKPDSMESLRLSLFCGEGLPASLAQQWQAAAPNSTLHNLYGPTEATIAISSYKIANNSKQESPTEKQTGEFAPIGRLFPKHQFKIDIPRSTNSSDRQRGELLVSGDQVFTGYWKNEKATLEKLVKSEDGTLWYKTGDIVSLNSEDDLVFHGRADHQIKFRGHRIELGEIETKAREAANTGLVAALAQTDQNDIVNAICLVIASTEQDKSSIQDYLERHLPAYMLPTKYLLIDNLPTNASGKIDRKALSKLISSP